MDDTDNLPASFNAASPRSKKSRSLSREERRKALAGLLRVAVAALFIVALYLSGRLGIEMAKDRLPDSTRKPSAIPASTPLTLGDSEDPVYLAESTDSLRRFFAEHPTPEERASANLSELGIRRLRGSVSMTTIRAEADAVEVQISSGAIAGTVYWIHHSQMPEPSTFDPIISPVPEDDEPLP